MTILNRPATLSLSGNLEEFRISSSGQISFVLKKGLVTLLTQTYDPDPEGIIRIDVKDMIHSSLSFTFRDTDSTYEQTTIADTFTAVIDNQEISFKVIRAGVDNFADTPENFLKANFLTWQPQVKKITYYTPEFLTYYATQAATVKVKGYIGSATGSVSTSTITLTTLTADKAYTIPVQYATINSKFTTGTPGAFDIWVESTGGTRLTYIQRYIASDLHSEQEQWILFENSLGGLDTFRAFGAMEFNGEHTHNIAEINELSAEYRVDTERKFQKNTGYLDKEQRQWLLDFFPSLKKYIYTGTSIRSIVVTESNVQYTDKDLPSNYNFTYKYADARPLLNLSRARTLPENITIQVPDLGSFTIPPRLIDFPHLPVSEGVLFPAQSPYSEEWGAVTAGTLAEYIKTHLGGGYEGDGGVGHSHNNIDLLEALGYDSGYLTVLGNKTNAAFADKAATALLFQTENFVKSMSTGRGGAIDKNGNGQLESLEVRSYLKVLELIYNRLNALEGDYSFTDFATIEEVEQLEVYTYKLTLRKRWENDFTALQVDDIIYGIVNDLLSDGIYYTSWMRVIQKDTSANSIIVVLYPNEAVPSGRNFPPAKSMNITRRGNANSSSGEHNNRQDSWHISSNDGAMMFLQGVDKPELDSENYAAILGLLPKLDIFKDLPINYDQPYLYAKGVVAQQIHRINYKGQVQKNVIERGPWSQEKANGEDPYRNTNLEVHTVYHLGCKWQCVTDQTKDAPKWNSQDWLFLEGNEQYFVDFESTNGTYFYYNKVDTTILAKVKFGSIDITDDLMKLAGTQIQWLRDTDDVPSDNAWKPTTGESRNSLKLSTQDMGDNFIHRAKTKFICNIYIPVGESFLTLSEEIGIQL